MNTSLRSILSALVVPAALAIPSQAAAYNYSTHARMPDHAFQVMRIVADPAAVDAVIVSTTGASVDLRAAPPGLPASQAAAWARFINEVAAAPALLDALPTGLADLGPHQIACNSAIPSLEPGELATCRAGQLAFPVDRSWGDDSYVCRANRGYLTGYASRAEPNPAGYPFFQALPHNYTGALLGFYSASVDDQKDDVHLWWRPTAFLPINVVLDAASTGIQVVVFLLAVPVLCLNAIFEGGNCLDDARNAARQGDVISYLETQIPGVGDISGDDMDVGGMWHFFNFNEDGDGDFNHLPGMKYLDGGHDGIVDALDYALIAAGEVGLTLNPEKSTGVERYERGDTALERKEFDWLEPLGRCEFEPLDNLAMYGWERFRDNGDASGLGWVLHALGDSVAPHHAIAATGWGHRPYEDYASQVMDKVYNQNDPTEALNQAKAELAEAFYWWQKMDAVTSTGADLPVEIFLQEMGEETWGQGEWALVPLISAQYILDGLGSVGEVFAGTTSAQFYYGGNEAPVRDLINRGTGATLAFLTKASTFVTPSTAPTPCSCPTGQAKRPDGTCGDCNLYGAESELHGMCVARCPEWAPVLVLDKCQASCPINAPYIWYPGPTAPGAHCISQCPTSAPYLIDNACSSYCDTDRAECVTNQGCSGSTPYEANGSCVATCPTQLPLAHGKQCVASCPASAPLTNPTSPQSTCVTECPTGWFVDENSTCTKPTEVPK